MQLKHEYGGQRGLRCRLVCDRSVCRLQAARKASTDGPARMDARAVWHRGSRLDKPVCVAEPRVYMPASRRDTAASPRISASSAVQREDYIKDETHGVLEGTSSSEEQTGQLACASGYRDHPRLRSSPCFGMAVVVCLHDARCRRALTLGKGAGRLRRGAGLESREEGLGAGHAREVGCQPDRRGSPALGGADVQARGQRVRGSIDSSSFGPRTSGSWSGSARGVGGWLRGSRGQSARLWVWWCHQATIVMSALAHEALPMLRQLAFDTVAKGGKKTGRTQRKSLACRADVHSGCVKLTTYTQHSAQDYREDKKGQPPSAYPPKRQENTKKKRGRGPSFLGCT